MRNRKKDLMKMVHIAELQSSNVTKVDSIPELVKSWLNTRWCVCTHIRNKVSMHIEI